jgi:hypothetical protein
MSAALARVPPGSVVVLVVGNTFLDWPWFGPGAGMSNRVVSWAEADFEPARLRGLVESRGATHVVVENAPQLAVRWAGVVPTGPVLLAVQRLPGFTESALPPGPVRLFERVP